MTQANDSILVTPGTGATVATHLANSKEHQVVMEADDTGHIYGTTDAYYLWQQPRVTTAAATDLLDLFNAAGSGKTIRLKGLWMIAEIRAANAFVASQRFDILKTSAVGTGGTAHTYKGVGAFADGVVNIAPPVTAAPALPAQVTARSVPTGGATALYHLWTTAVLGEELNASNPLHQYFNQVPLTQAAGGVIPTLVAGEGMKVRQTLAVASTGVAFGWLLAFDLV